MEEKKLELKNVLKWNATLLSSNRVVR